MFLLSIFHKWANSILFAVSTSVNFNNQTSFCRKLVTNPLRIKGLYMVSLEGEPLYFVLVNE